MEAQFDGKYRNTRFDDKKRICIPAKFREICRICYRDDERLMLAITPYRCLSAHPTQRWPEIVEMTRKWEEEGDENSARFRQFYLTSAEEVKPDGQGRIVIPDHLKEWAGLNREIHWFGKGRHFEVWDSARYDKYVGEIDFEAMGTPYRRVAVAF